MISPLAYIDPKAKLGQGVTVEPFAYIEGDVVIGDGSWISHHASVLDGVTMGKNCKVHSGAVVGGIPQDLKFQGEKTTVEIGDGTIIRECVTVNRGTAAKGVTRIGNNCLLMAYSHVGHDCEVGNHVILVNGVALAGEVVVDDWAILSANVAVHQFSRIGAHAMISGGTMVNKDIPPYVKCAHAPVAYVGLNTIGLRRRGFSSEQISQIQQVARILFQGGHTYDKGCDIVEKEVQQSEVRDDILRFIRESKRGCLKQYQPKANNDDLD